MLIQLTEDLTETQLENVAASVGLYLSPAIGKYKGEVLRIMRPIGLVPDAPKSVPKGELFCRCGESHIGCPLHGYDYHGYVR